MARYTDSVCRLCRRQQEKLFLKGNRCNTDKCAVNRRNFPPGQHGSAKTRMKLSNYGLQMREKQKVKRIYGILERQFRGYFAIASRSKGVTGKVLLQLLERRIDNVIFRMGLGLSRSHARQIVRHNHVAVNGKRVNIPSYLIRPGDIISIQGTEKSKNRIKENLEYTKERTVPAWLEFVPAQLTARVVRLPERSDILHPIEEQLIVELYSK
ncbi:MAG TPA: 30S ribosomal protein S4 [Candidatus Omnitrophota bacterium]|nr:30S ribosomal protein S4 [Candidatus Omnitrophota bacterium]